MDQAAFFRALYENCEALVEFRPIPGRSEFFPQHLYETPHHVVRYCAQNKGRNLYFGVGTRDGEGGRKRNLVEIPAVWADIDFKDTPPQRIRENITAFPFRPSMAVHSGGGYHLYWVLQEPAGRDSIAMVESVNRRIAHALGGDPNSVDAARILRVPGTVNLKRDKPVRLKHIANFRYNIDDFLELPEPERKSTPPAGRTTESAGEDHQRLVAVFSCRFLRWAYQNQASVSEPLWYAVLSTLCRLSPGGIGLCHEFSSGHPGYSREQCESKILHALDAAGPHSCAFIRRHGFEDCGDCDVKSPLGQVLKTLKGL